MKNTQVRAGFTLIELMICIVIIGILAMAILPIFVKSKYQAQLAGCQFNLRGIASAAENYHTEKDVYPSDSGGIESLVTNGFISPLPKCPAGNIEYGYEANDAAENYTAYCAGGLHNLVLKVVDEGYPQYNPSVGIIMKEPD